VSGQSKSILLISCYELGHQPAGISMPMGFLRRAGYEAEAMDLSVEVFDAERVKRAKFIGISVPMHTALRLGVRAAEECRRINPNCHICFYGMYASLNASHLLSTVADSIIGGEFEQKLLELIEAVLTKGDIDIEGVSTRAKMTAPVLERLAFPVPERGELPGLERYARLEHRGGQQLAGYVEASRGCLHHCAHCPIPPVYAGRFFVIPRSVVLDDIRNLVAMGARHITFGDPDFLNGPRHSLRIVESMHEEFPDLTFDFTAKIEHIIKYRDLIPEFARRGCIFLVSAIESLNDEVLAWLEKGHTRADVMQALRIVRNCGIALRPSFVPFTPWATIEDYIAILQFVESEGLIENVDPVQYTIRLLIPPGSRLLSKADTKAWIGPLVQPAFTYNWTHPDPRMDELHRQVSLLVEQSIRSNESATEIFYKLCDLAYSACGVRVVHHVVSHSSLLPPRLTESWFC
jgi:radical SAM superfamily enzyme YgiQ (UPF0313 family)